MSDLIKLKTLRVGDALEVIIELPKPATVSEKSLAEKARLAADGEGAAPQVQWAEADLEGDGGTPLNVRLTLLGEILNFASDRLKPSPRVCVIRRKVPGESSKREQGFGIVSGSITIEKASTPTDEETRLLTRIWPTPMEERFGSIERLLVAPTALVIETVTDNERRRFELVRGPHVEPPGNGVVRLAWRQLAWRDQPHSASHKNPRDRVEQLRAISKERFARRVSQPVRHVSKFDGQGVSADSVVIQVRLRKDPQDASVTISEAREVITPTWALALGGADWAPRSLTIAGHPLDSAVLRYSNAEDAFDEPAAIDVAPRDELQTRLQWKWSSDTPAAHKRVIPMLMKLATSPPLLSTGKFSGAGANRPFLWQMTRLVVKGSAETVEPSVWIRYQVDSLLERETARSRRDDVEAGLSRPISIEELRRTADSSDADEPWRLDLGLLPDQPIREGAARLWVEVHPISETEQKVDLILAGARIQAATPHIRALALPLADPAAVPNRPDLLAGLNPRARIVLSNDVMLPPNAGDYVRALQASHKPGDGLRVSAWKGNHDVVVAYVAGPLAGIDLVSRARGNLHPRKIDASSDRPPPERVREFLPGRVAVHLLMNIDLSSLPDAATAPAGEVRVSATTDLFLPRTEAVATLLPTALWQVQQGSFSDHVFQPLHHNAALEAFDWAVSAPDRHDPQPSHAPPTIDPGPQRPKPRDYRHDESLCSLAKAVRDRFSRASKTLAVGEKEPLKHWLDQVELLTTGGAAVTPKMEIELPPTAQLADIPKLLLTWPNVEIQPQSLALTPSPGLDASALDPTAFRWCDAWLRWLDPQPEIPKLRIYSDQQKGLHAARHATRSDVPLLEHRTPIRAVTAAWLNGRNWVIFATGPKDFDQGPSKLFAWEPLAGAEPIELTGLPLQAAPIDHLDADGSTSALAIAVAQGTSWCVLHFQEVNNTLRHWRSDAPDPDNPAHDLPARITALRLAAQRLFLGYDSGNETLVVFEVDAASPVSKRVGRAMGPVYAIDIRGDAEGARKITVAAATDTEVQVFQWPLPLNDADPALGPVKLEVNLAPGETIESVTIQPLTFPLDPVDRVFAFASTRKGDQPGRIVSWNLTSLSSSTPVRALTGQSPDLQVLQRIPGRVARLVTDPGLNNDTELSGGIPLARWLIGVSAASMDGRSSLAALPIHNWGVADTHDEDLKVMRPEIGAALVFGDHEGEITDVAVVPGRQAGKKNLNESRLGTWIVTAGADGTVRVWDPETGLERYRHTRTASGAWLDTLGVVRTPLKPIEVLNRTDETKVQFWAEPINVPDDQAGARKTIVMLSTLGEPVDLLGDSLPHSSFRFTCQHLPLQLLTQPGTWQLVPWNNDDDRHRWLHGVFGCDGGTDADGNARVPKLAGMPIEVVRLVSIKLDNFSLSPWPSSGSAVVPAEIVLDAVLANPAEPAPSPNVVRLDVDVATIRLKFIRADSGYTLSVGDLHGRFDWRFPLTDQVSTRKAVLPGRLVRLTGRVSLSNSRWQLTPESKVNSDDSAQLLSQAEALGRLRDIPDIPELVFDPGAAGNEVRFREKDTQAALDPFGNHLPKPPGQDSATLVATALGATQSNGPVALLATQPDGNNQGAAVLTDLGTGRRLTNYMDGLRRARLVVDPKSSDKERWLSVVGVAFDGTVRTRRLWMVTENNASADVTETGVAADHQEWAAYALPSPVEDVEVLNAIAGPNKRRLILARCRDGSAWLWDAVTGGFRHDVSLPETAVTTIAFGPPIPQEYFDDGKPEYQPWREFFRSVEAQLKGNLLGVFALGGADGSMHVCAIDKEDGPVLARTFFEFDAPLRSLSITVDKNSLEARRLGRGPSESTLPGLVILGCDGAGPAKLIEILSGRSLIDAKTPSANDAFKPESVALCGQVMFAGDALRVVLQVASARGADIKLIQLRKSVGSQLNEFSAATLDIEGIDTAKDLLITTVVGESGHGGVAVSEPSIGWADLDLDGSLKHRTTVFVPVVDVSVEEVFGYRYLVGVLPNGAIRMWKAKVLPFDRWNDGPEVSTPTHFEKAALGRAAVPLIACRGQSDQAGYCWAADLWEGSLTWPETLGPVAKDWPVALTSLEGMPHLAVGRPGDVTVWNLETGNLVYRVGVDSLPTKLQAATEFDEVWLLIAADNGENTNFRLVNASRQSVPEEIVTAPKADVDVRLFAGPAGLQLVRLERDATQSPQLRITVQRIQGQGTVGPSQTSVVDDVDGSLEILDFTSFADEAPWLLARATVDNTNRTIVAVFLAATAGVVNRLTPATGESPLFATFDLDPDPASPNRPVVWTCSENWTTFHSWTLDEATSRNDLEPGTFQLTESPKQEGDSADTRLAAIRSDGRTRLIAVATGGLAVWDISNQRLELVRAERLHRADTRLAAVPVNAVMATDTNADCVRIWDQSSGRLRQRLIDTASSRLSGLSKPTQLATVPTTARPRLVVSGDTSSTIVDLGNYLTLGSVQPPVTSLTADLATPSDGDLRHLVIAGIITSPQRQIKIWHCPVGSEASLLARPLEQEDVDDTVKAVALIQLERRVSRGPNIPPARPGRTLLAKTDGPKLTVREVVIGGGSGLRSILALSEDDVRLIDGQTDQVGESLCLSAAFEEQCLIAAVRLRSQTESSLVVIDLPLRAAADNETIRPFTRWQAKQQLVSDLVAAACDSDGVLILAGNQAFRPRPLLRVGGKRLRFDLPVQLLKSDDLLRGRITPAYRLDLEIPVRAPRALGLGMHAELHKHLQRLRVRAVLVQGTYSCFLLDSIEHDTFRLGGGLVLWEDESSDAHRLRGVLLLEDSYPVPAAQPEDPSFGAAASIQLSKADGVPVDISASGPRVRFRAIPFAHDSGALETLAWREILTWNLAGRLGEPGTGRSTQWHLSEIVFDRPVGQVATSQQVVRATLSGSSDSVQGDVIVSVKREVDSSTTEKYTLSVENAVYAAQPIVRPQRNQSGTTRDDVVYPATPGASVGLTFDLFEQTNATAPFQLVTLRAGNDGTLELVTVSAADVPLELSSGGEITLPLPIQPVQVPQLVHREAHGARLRARWSPLELVPPPQKVGNDLLAAPATASWLLAPLAHTPRGVRALTLGLLVDEAGKPLDWTRLRTENVLTINDHGGALFAQAAEGSQVTNSPSVMNLLTNTILGSSGAAGRTPAPVFDDKRIQSHALRTGLTGILLARTSDARGRVTFRFINSPYHSLIPVVTKRRTERGDAGNHDTPPERVDARLLSPQATAKLATLGAPRYQPQAPTADRPESRAFRRFVGNIPGDHSQSLMLYLGEIPALRGATRPALPLQTRMSFVPTGQDLHGFLPPYVDLGFGLSKPGASVYQVLRALATDTTSGIVQAALPTEFVRREPQRLMPPSRAAIQLQSPDIKLEGGAAQVEVAWKEVLGFVSFANAQLTQSAVIEELTTDNFTIQDATKVVVAVTRLGEQIRQVPFGNVADADNLAIPLSAFRDGRSLDGFDLILVTRVDLKSFQHPSTAGGNPFTPYLVACDNSKALLQEAPPIPLTDVMTESTSDGFRMWRMTRGNDEPPRLLKWLSGIKDVNSAFIDIVWLNKAIESDAEYVQAAKLTPKGIRLKDVAYLPQSPRLAVAVRVPTPGLLPASSDSEMREFTLFDGPAASAKGVTVEVTRETGERSRIQFEASDAETLFLADPLAECGLFVVKIFEDGSTLYASQTVTATT